MTVYFSVNHTARAQQLVVAEPGVVLRDVQRRRAEQRPVVQ